MTKDNWLLLLMMGLLLAGCATNAVSAAPLPGDPEKGFAIYQTGGEVGIPCESCHSLDGTQIVGPSWQGLAERAGTRIEGMSGPDYLRASIRNPSTYVVEGFDDVMPHTYGEVLSDEDIDDVIRFIYSMAE